jgi:hypothetical protein
MRNDGYAHQRNGASRPERQQLAPISADPNLLRAEINASTIQDVTQPTRIIMDHSGTLFDIDDVENTLRYGKAPKAP